MNEAQIALDHYLTLTITEEIKKYTQETGTKDVNILMGRINAKISMDMRERGQIAFNGIVDRITKITEELVKKGKTP